MEALKFVLLPNPGDPFSSYDTAFADLIRMVSIMGGVVLIGSILAVGKNLKNTRQYGCYCVAAYTMAAIWTEVERFGYPGTMRLAFNVMGLTFGLIYVYRVRREWQREAGLKPDRRQRDTQPK